METKTHLIGDETRPNKRCAITKIKLIVTAVSIVIAMSATNAHAVLERVGPVSNAPALGGFPAWYQDTTGLAVEFCSPTNQAEVNGGWCLLVPGDPPSVPEVFPVSFFDEHFYFAAGAAMTTAGGAKASLTLAVESAFATAVQPGDQITFSRIRVLLNPVPVTGTYRFIHPYGEESIDAIAGDRIFFTDDIGIGGAPGDFSGALQSRLGPLLLASNTPGGAELPAVQGPAGKYIADPGRTGPVTGSTLPNFIDSTGASRDHNIYRIEGPAGSGLGTDVNGALVNYIETTDFSLMGRIFTGVIPGRVDVQRASYTNTGSGKKVDVYATANATTHGRLPTELRPAAIAPQLTFFDTACTGTIDQQTGEVLPPFSAPGVGNEIQMVQAAPNMRWGQAQPSFIPASICVKDSSSRNAAGNVIPTYYSKKVTDEVTIGNASFDPIAGILSVQASSSDTVAPPILSLAFGTFLGSLTSGQIQVSGLSAPPSEVNVLSDAGGKNSAIVASDFGNGSVGPNNVPVAVNDAFTLVEDSPTMLLNVLQNDSQVNGGTAVITSLPRLGTASVDANGNVVYKPNLNASGIDQFTYAVSNGPLFSNPGAVTVNITPVNDAPTAVNDSASAIAGTAIQINVLANDIDPDGAADLVGITNLTQPAGTTVSAVGGVVTFKAAVGGFFYTFSYNAVDSAGVASANPATVTVQVAAGETLSIARNDYVRSKGTLRTEGTLTPAAGQTVKLEFFDARVGGGVIGLPIATVFTDVTGAWAFRQAVPLPPNATAVRATSSNGGVSINALSIK